MVMRLCTLVSKASKWKWTSTLVSCIIKDWDTWFLISHKQEPLVLMMPWPTSLSRAVRRWAVFVWERWSVTHCWLTVLPSAWMIDWWSAQTIVRATSALSAAVFYRPMWIVRSSSATTCSQAPMMRLNRNTQSRRRWFVGCATPTIARKCHCPSYWGIWQMSWLVWISAWISTWMKRPHFD